MGIACPLQMTEYIHRMAMAFFLGSFHHDGIFGPTWWGWGVHAHPLHSTYACKVPCQPKSHLFGSDCLWAILDHLYFEMLSHLFTESNWKCSVCFRFNCAWELSSAFSRGVKVPFQPLFKHIDEIETPTFQNGGFSLLSHIFVNFQGFHFTEYNTHRPHTVTHQLLHASVNYSQTQFEQIW